MNTINIPQLTNDSLYCFLQKQGIDGMDISDEIWDWGVYICCESNWELCPDYYSRCMLLFCLNIELTKFRENWYSTCKVAEFIKYNLPVFRKFFNEENREGYRPMDYEHADDIGLDDGFFEAYMQSMESLIVGNYTEDDYEKLFKMLTTKEQLNTIIHK